MKIYVLYNEDRYPIKCFLSKENAEKYQQQLLETGSRLSEIRKEKSKFKNEYENEHPKPTLRFFPNFSLLNSTFKITKKPHDELYNELKVFLQEKELYDKALKEYETKRDAAISLKLAANGLELTEEQERLLEEYSYLSGNDYYEISDVDCLDFCRNRIADLLRADII